MELKNNLKNFILTGVILTILNTLILFTIIGKGIYDQISGKGKEGTVVLANVDPEVAKKVTSQFVNRNISGEGQQYYSPTLDTMFTYDSSKYYLFEGENSLSISERGNYSSTVYTRIFTFSESINKDDFLKQLDYLYDDVKTEEEFEIEGLKAIRFSYVKESVIDSKRTLYNTVYIISGDGEKGLYANVTYPDNQTVTQLLSDISKILKSADQSPANLDTNIKLVIPNGGVQIEYDKKRWKVDTVTDSNAYISFRSKEFESKEENRFAITTMSIITSFHSQNSSLEETHEIFYKSDLTSEFKKNIKVIEQNKEITLAGTKFLYTEYEYDDFGNRSRQRVYTGLDASASNSITIKIWSDRPGLDGEKEVEKLLSTLTLNVEISRGNNSENGNVLGTSTLEIEKAAILGKPAVSHIFNRTCVNIKVDGGSGFIRTVGKTYDACTGGFGTAFFVSSNGYLVSNAHVAAPSGLDAVLAPLLRGEVNTDFWNDFAFDVGYILSSRYSQDLRNFSQQELLLLIISTFIELNQNGLITLTPTYSNFIEGDQPFKINPSTLELYDEHLYKKAILVDSSIDSIVLLEYNAAKENKPAELKTPDLAVLQIDNPENDYPTLRLSPKELISSGMVVNVLGFPGVANNTSLFASGISAIPTITKGTISSIKPNPTGEFNLVQIDAAISGGNSGGPIINSNGEVVAVATYGITEGQGHYNVGVSIEEVDKILSKKGITRTEGAITEYLTSGVDNLQKEYYKNAIKDFKKVIELYPSSKESIDPLIAIAERKIEEGEDKTPLLNTHSLEKILYELGIKLSGNTILIGLIALIGLIISGTAVVIMIIVKKRKERKKEPPIVGNYEVPPQPTTSVPIQPTGENMNPTSIQTQQPPQEPPVIQQQPNVEVPPIPETHSQQVSPEPQPVGEQAQTQYQTPVQPLEPSTPTPTNIPQSSTPVIQPPLTQPIHNNQTEDLVQMSNTTPENPPQSIA